MPRRHPSFRQLEAFTAVLDSGSITRAASRLHISQPAISRLIAHLEAGVGYPLFRRAGGRLVPTVEAELVRDEIQDALRSVERAGRRILKLADTTATTLSVAAFPALATTTLPLVLSRFRLRHPRLHVTLQASNAIQRMISLVSAEDIDFAISNVPARSAAIAADHLCRYPAVCVVRRDHAFAAAGRATLEAIARESFVALVADDDSQVVVDRAFHARGLEVEPVAAVSHCAAACAWVATSGGCAIVDPFTAGEWDGQLARVAIDPPIWLDLWMLRPAERPMTRIASACLDELRDHLLALPEIVRRSAPRGAAETPRDAPPRPAPAKLRHGASKRPALADGATARRRR